MNAVIEHKTGGRAAIRVTADWPEVAADYEDVLAAYAGLAVPGFRPGKAPRGVIEQRFRPQIRADFTARCGRRLVRDALRERDLGVAGPVTLGSIQFEPNRPFGFIAECVPVPRLVLPDYTAVRLSGADDDRRRDELGEWLLARTAWDAPEPLVREECERDGPAEPGSNAWRAAAQRVKLMEILDQIAEAEGIEADAGDVDARIAKMAADCGAAPVALRRQLGEDGVNRLRALLRAEQTLEHLLGRASASAGAVSRRS